MKTLVFVVMLTALGVAAGHLLGAGLYSLQHGKQRIEALCDV